MPGKDLLNKTALVTGAAKRLGREISLRLADSGVNIIAHYSASAKEAEELKKEIEARGACAWLIQADFEKGEYEGLIERALKLAGSLDILVNNASVFFRNTLEDITFDDLTRQMRINAWAPFELGRDFFRLVNHGKIVNLVDSRVTGYDWKHVNYMLTKHVLKALTEMTAVDYAPKVIVNGVNPGLILPPPGKDMSFLEKMSRTVPLKKHGSPSDIAGAVKYILESDFLVGEIINVDGGRHLMEYDGGPHPD